MSILYSKGSFKFWLISMTIMKAVKHTQTHTHTHTHTHTCTVLAMKYLTDKLYFRVLCFKQTFRNAVDMIGYQKQ